MRIAICDDEEVQRELISKCVRKYFNGKDFIVHIDEYESAEQLLFQPHCNFDIILLDINMNGMDGITLAKELRKSSDELAIIFITGMTDYIFEGFEVQAINYLIKPFNEEKLNMCLEKAIKQCSSKEDYLIIKVDKELVKLKKSQVLRVESQGHYANIILLDRQYRIKKTMRDIESELKENIFFKVSRSDLVNLYGIERITSKEILLINGESISIPKGKHSEVSEAFMNCHFRREQF